MCYLLVDSSTDGCFVVFRSASGKYQPASANNTLNRPRADLAGHRYDDKTLPPINRQENRMDMNNIHAMNERTPTQTPDRGK